MPESAEKKNARARAWYAANVERLREAYRVRYAANPRAKCEKTKAWKRANADRVREAAKEWRNANREQVNARARERRAADPEKYRAKARARYAADADKARAYATAWRAAKPGLSCAYTKAWAAANPEKAKACNKRRRARARGAEGAGVPDQWFEIWYTHWGEICAYCGKACVAPELDHITPLVLGGTNEPHNLAPACKSCNCSKNAREPENWRPDLARAVRVRAASASALIKKQEEAQTCAQE